MQIAITMSYHYIFSNMVKIKNSGSVKCWQGQKLDVSRVKQYNQLQLANSLEASCETKYILTCIYCTKAHTHTNEYMERLMKSEYEL